MAITRPGSAGLRPTIARYRPSRSGVWRSRLNWWALVRNRPQRFSGAEASPANTAPSAHKPYGSFEEFFHTYEGELFSYLWRMTGDEQTASDLCQETFLRAWQHFAKVSAYERPAGWLFRVATNLALNHLRLRAMHSAVGSLDAVEKSSGDLATEIVEGDAVRRTLMSLNPRQRAALVLREVYGLSCEEIAHILGTSSGAVKIILWRSRDAFRGHYQHEGGEL
jgi:RNA polymerase sigma-70 factor, ECF subfamily